MADAAAKAAEANTAEIEKLREDLRNAMEQIEELKKTLLESVCRLCISNLIILIIYFTHINIHTLKYSMNLASLLVHKTVFYRRVLLCRLLLIEHCESVRC